MLVKVCSINYLAPNGDLCKLCKTAVTSVRLDVYKRQGRRITAWNGTETLLSKTYYSVGGGFIVEEEQFGQALSLIHI